VAALRQRTRYRKKLIEQRGSELQRLSKVLEAGGIKIDSVASTLTTAPARDMIEALIAGQQDPATPARLARGVMRKKIPELEMACDGRFTDSHAQMCQLHLDAYDHLGAQIAGLDRLVAGAAAPFARLIARLLAIPGVGQRTAEVIVAETGGDMTRFATPARLAAWAGLAPGDNKSAGKRKRAAARKDNQHLRTAMVESAWTVSPHRHPARHPVPPPGRPVRPRPREESRGRRRAHPHLHRLGGDALRRRLRRSRSRLLRPPRHPQPRLPGPPPPAGPHPAWLPGHLSPPGDGSPPPAQAA
jgi:transposase